MLQTDFFEQLASKSPAPGGGAVSALCGQLAGGLLIMVRELSRPEERAEIEHLRVMTQKLEQLISTDTMAFCRLMEAFRLPKNTDNEIENRKTAIQLALRAATLVPLKTAQLSAELLELAAHMPDITKKSCASDLGVALVLARSAVQGALMNVEINLGGLKEPELYEEVSEKVKDIKTQSAHFFRKTEEKLKEKGLLVIPEI